MKCAVILISLLMAGCEAMVPNVLRPEIEHVSHLTQHAPFTSSPDNYGYDQVSITARWNTTEHTILEVSEGINLDRYFNNPPAYGYGALCGPREIFTARFGYEFKLK